MRAEVLLLGVFTNVCLLMYKLRAENTASVQYMAFERPRPMRKSLTKQKVQTEVLFLIELQFAA